MGERKANYNRNRSHHSSGRQKWKSRCQQGCIPFQGPLCLSLLLVAAGALGCGCITCHLAFFCLYKDTCHWIHGPARCSRRISSWGLYLQLYKPFLQTRQPSLATGVRLEVSLEGSGIQPPWEDRPQQCIRCPLDTAGMMCVFPCTKPSSAEIKEAAHFSSELRNISFSLTPQITQGGAALFFKAEPYLTSLCPCFLVCKLESGKSTHSRRDCMG